ncbi:MAG: tRNA (adenosine(37)-N6)-threonylcarbamoyltransferase complex ATPase subunit type 1 TsaE [Patescibacteria group bacterium]
MKGVSFETNSAKKTQKIAEILAKELLKTHFEKHALVLALSGELGSGKTTFVRGLAAGFGIKSKISSPTFVIAKRYALNIKRYKNFYHIDAYRLAKPKYILSLGWRDMVGDPKNIIAIEWARHIKKVLPKRHIDINFKHVSKNKRKIVFYAE